MYGKESIKDFKILGLQCHITFENTDQQTNNLKCHSDVAKAENESICFGVSAYK